MVSQYPPDMSHLSYLPLPFDLYNQQTISSNANGLLGLAAKMFMRGILVIVAPSPNMVTPKILDSKRRFFIISSLFVSVKRPQEEIQLINVL